MEHFQLFSPFLHLVISLLFLQSLIKSVSLAGAIIEDWEEKGSKNIFSITPKETKRKYVFSSNDSEEHKKWLQAICLAKIFENTASEKSEACVIQ